MGKIYHVVCVSDEGYVQHTAVMLCSLFENNRGKQFHVYLFTTGMEENSQERLTRLCWQYGAELACLRCGIDDLSDLPIGQWHAIMYLKLRMPQLLPADVERCLFLDVDMVVNDDISLLYDVDLDGAVIAAAEDMPDCVEIKKRIGLQQEDAYINSGVMVCDLNAWRKMETERPVFDFTRSVASIITNEQDVIALYFRGKIKLLPIRWNMTTFYFHRKPKIFDKYLPQLKDARRNPGIIHFACPIKPWFKDCQHPYKKLYKHYLQMTAWRDYKFPIFENMTPWGRTKRIVRLFLNRIGVMKDEGYNIRTWL